MRRAATERPPFHRKPFLEKAPTAGVFQRKTAESAEAGYGCHTFILLRPLLCKAAFFSGPRNSSRSVDAPTPGAIRKDPGKHKARFLPGLCCMQAVGRITRALRGCTDFLQRDSRSPVSVRFFLPGCTPIRPRDLVCSMPQIAASAGG